jgi:hypothetical protein
MGSYTNLLRDKPERLLPERFLISLRTALAKQELTLSHELQHCAATALARFRGIY